jgi:hypothetical protein
MNGKTQEQDEGQMVLASDADKPRIDIGVLEQEWVIAKKEVRKLKKKIEEMKAEYIRLREKSDAEATEYRDRITDLKKKSVDLQVELGCFEMKTMRRIAKLFEEATPWGYKMTVTEHGLFVWHDNQKHRLSNSVVGGCRAVFEKIEEAEVFLRREIARDREAAFQAWAREHPEAVPATDPEQKTTFVTVYEKESDGDRS